MNAPIRTLALVLAALSASACVSLLPKSDQAVLYRFDVDPVGGDETGAVRQVGLLKPPARFPQAAAGDRILTVTGGQAAYIAAARWVAPANVLFDEAVAREASIGLLLPCNVVVRAEGDNRTVVETVDPEVLVSVTENEELTEVAQDARTRLDAALADLPARLG